MASVLQHLNTHALPSVFYEDVCAAVSPLRLCPFGRSDVRTPASKQPTRSRRVDGALLILGIFRALRGSA